MNEDIVLPLEALAEFARYLDGLNVEEERFAQGRLVDRVEEILRGAVPPKDDPSGWPPRSRPRWSAAPGPRRHRARRPEGPPLAGARSRTSGATRPSWSAASRSSPGAMDAAHQEVRDRLVVLATHMHAGDGNVHVNVPVLSNDRPMLQRAEQVIDQVMAKVVSLGGVVSGEHGIGVTKLKYLEPERIQELSAHRREVDPGALMNPGKLEDVDVLDRVFTPSFNLLELEARILQHGQLEELARSIAHCVRCGKCKPDCCVYHPARGMFFHPRNKNLAIGALIEALLYDAQRERSTTFELLRWLEEVADHCTICHKCLKPCPVDIDTGEVSVLEREILSGWGYKRSTAATRATLGYLESRSPTYNKLFRGRWSGWAARCSGPAASSRRRSSRAEGAPRPYSLQLLRSPVAEVPARDAARRHPRVRAGPGAGVRAGARGGADGVLLPRLRLGAAAVAHLDGGAARARRARDAGDPAAAVPVLRLPDAREREDRHVLAHGAAGHHPVQPDPGDVQLPRLRRLRGHLRHLPRGARGDGGRQALRRPDRGHRALRAGARAEAARAREEGVPLPRPLPRLARRQGAGGAGEARRVREGRGRAALLLGGRHPLPLAAGHHQRHAAPQARGVRARRWRDGRAGPRCSPTARPACRAWPGTSPWASRRSTWPRCWPSGSAAPAGWTGSGSRPRRRTRCISDARQGSRRGRTRSVRPASRSARGGFP